MLGLLQTRFEVCQPSLQCALHRVFGPGRGLSGCRYVVSTPRRYARATGWWGGWSSERSEPIRRRGITRSVIRRTVTCREFRRVLFPQGIKVDRGFRLDPWQAFHSVLPCKRSPPLRRDTERGYAPGYGGLHSTYIWWQSGE